MNPWTIGDGELRRQVVMQEERYRDLRRRSEEVRLIEAARRPRRNLRKRLHSWLQALWGHARHTNLPEPVSSEALKRGHG